MKLFIVLLLQVLLFLPFTSHAESGLKGLVTQNHKATSATEAKKAEIKSSYGKLPLYFIKNNGQVDSQVSFYERGAGHATFFTSDGVVLSLTKKDDKSEKPSFKKDILGLETEESAMATTESVSLSFVGANAKGKIFAGDNMSGKVNYFVGNDRSKWRSNIPTYGAVTYKDAYKDIDIKFYGNNRRLEHDVIVRPGGDISNVKFAYRGIKGLKVRSTGDLEVSLKNGKLLEQKPLIYQKVDGKRLAVDGAYKLLGEKDGAFIYGFNVASYDHTKKIVIDPLLAWSTYLGGNGLENGRAIAVDSSGAAYVTGDTTASNFPVVNPVQGTPAGNAEVFITKINPSGTALVYSTYLGGSLNDFAFGIAVDSAGSAYVTGNTSSQNFPLMNPVQATNPGGSAAFITKLSPTGSALVYSTLLGGGSPEEGHAIAVDSTGAAYVTGLTRSTDFPVVNPIQATYGGGSDDAFITKINPAGSAYVYSTYLGGNGGPSAQEDIGNGIAVDNTGAAYVVGLTVSPDFPVMNPIQPNLGSGFSDAFITKVNPAGSALVYSTYLGGVAADQGFGIAIDGTGAAYVTGQTDFQDFPLVNPIQGVFGGTTDAFVTKIDPTGSIIVYSTFLGGSHAENGSAIAVGSDGSAYITGQTLSTDFPVVSPVQATIGGGGLFDTFVTEINPAGSAFVFSTYLGGTGDDVGFGIAVDSAGSAYIVGRARSTDFPLVNPIQANSGFDDAYVAKIGTVIPPPPPPVVTVTLLPDITTVAHGGTLGYNVTAMNTTAVQQCFEYWENANLPDGSLFPTTDSLFKPVPRLCLNAGASKTVHLTHGVPMSAPLGAYVFNSYVGIFPFSFRAVVDTTSFNFNVTALGPLTNHPATSWRLMENGFRK